MEHLSVALLVASLTVLRFAPAIDRDYVSAVYGVAPAFTSAVASWNVKTPPGSWIDTQLRTRIGQRWTAWYELGNWSAARSGGHRHSRSAGGDRDGRVQTDTLVLTQPADAWQLRVQVHASPQGAAPAVSLLSVTTGPALPPPPDAAVSHRAWGIDLDVPQRTQRVDESPDALGGGGDAWCSPASVSMVMAYWAQREHQPQWNVDVATVASGTYDPVYDGCGNWPFNVAFASEHGLAGWVERLGGLPEMERYLAAGIPLVASIKAAKGELSGSPYEQTNGHLLVVRGLSRDGDVIVNDPYALPGHIRIVYPRAQFQHAWMNGSGGIVYVIAPPDILAGFMKGRDFSAAHPP